MVYHRISVTSKRLTLRSGVFDTDSGRTLQLLIDIKTDGVEYVLWPTYLNTPNADFVA